MEGQGWVNRVRMVGDAAATRLERARAIRSAGGFEAALAQGTLPRCIDTTLSEALVLGLLRQGVRVFVGVLGHGSTEIGEVLRVYEEAGLVRTCGVRSEIEASHAATALRWVTGEKAAVVTSIGPGALQALAASIAPASDGIGVWYLFGDETTEDEGPNMQQIPHARAGGLPEAVLGDGARLHAAHAAGAVGGAAAWAEHGRPPAPRRAVLPAAADEHAVQPAAALQPGRAAGRARRRGWAQRPTMARYDAAARRWRSAERVVVRVGGGAREAGPELLSSWSWPTPWR